MLKLMDCKQVKNCCKYNKIVDSESAYEILTEKLNEAAKEDEEIKQRKAEEKAERKSAKEEKGFFDDPIVKSMTRTAGNTIVRFIGCFGSWWQKPSQKIFILILPIPHYPLLIYFLPVEIRSLSRLFLFL